MKKKYRLSQSTMSLLQRSDDDNDINDVPRTTPPPVAVAVSSTIIDLPKRNNTGGVIRSTQSN